MLLGSRRALSASERRQLEVRLRAYSSSFIAPPEAKTAGLLRLLAEFEAVVAREGVGEIVAESHDFHAKDDEHGW